MSPGVFALSATAGMGVVTASGAVAGAGFASGAVGSGAVSGVPAAGGSSCADAPAAGASAEGAELGAASPDGFDAPRGASPDGVEAGGVASPEGVWSADGVGGGVGAVQRRKAPQESQNDWPVARAGVPQSGQGTMAGVDMKGQFPSWVRVFADTSAVKGRWAGRAAATTAWRR